MIRRSVVVLILAWAFSAVAADDDPALAAALARCPGAAEFIRLHGDPSSAAVRAEPAAPTKPALRAQLLEMERVDQDARSGDWSPPMIQKMLAVDAINLPQIKRIVAEHDGLPDATEVGADGLAAAWVLVQHADQDPAFQQHVLAKVGPLLDSGQLSSHAFVLLTDRVLAGQDKPQRFGSQLLAVDGKWVPKPMEAPSQVDQRRAGVGEMALADYICVATAMMPPPSADVRPAAAAAD
jgi:hypothetical protein